MFAVLVASFVVVCVLAVWIMAAMVLRHNERNRLWLAQQIEEDVRAGVFDDIVVPRMDPVGKYPAIRTRSSKVKVW